MARGSLEQVARTFFRFAPRLLEHWDVLFDMLWGGGRFPPKVRFAFHLRLARLSRSPVGLILFPALARVVGLSSHEIDAALSGDIDKLDEETACVVAWASAIADADGEMPLEWPPEARTMTMRERERILMLTRLALVFYAISNVPVPSGFLGADPRDESTT